MIKIDNFTKKFDDVTILDSISLNIPKGSIYGLIGSNGAGKSTILNSISGIYDADGGKITVLGGEIKDNIAAKDSIAYINDDVYFFNSYTMLDMAKYFANIYPSFSMDKFNELTKIFPLDINKKINTFSKGMKRQAAIVLALSRNPKILLCDESFDGLDPVMRKLVKRIIIKEVTENDMTAVISSHNMSELDNFCDIIGVVYKNKLIFEKRLDDVKDSIHKFQLAFKPMISESDLHNIDIINVTIRSSIMELVARGNADDITKKLSNLNPLIIDKIPITLDDIFIYEMEGQGYDASKMLD